MKETRPGSLALVDTSRAADYNEIDAVELVGPSGSGYAIEARASSAWKAGDPIVRFPPAK